MPGVRESHPQPLPYPSNLQHNNFLNPPHHHDAPSAPHQTRPLTHHPAPNALSNLKSKFKSLLRGGSKKAKAATAAPVAAVTAAAAATTAVVTGDDAPTDTAAPDAVPTETGT